MMGSSDQGPTDEALLETALAAAREAAELHRSEAGRVDPADWAEKGTADFVSEVDLEAERRIVRRLRDRFPEHLVVAEEGTVEQAPGSGKADAPRDAEIRWIIDPLDGTTNWLHGYPEYAVSIAALDAEGLRVGVVLNSATAEEFTAVRGGGSRRNGDPIRTSPVKELRLALLGTGFPFKRLDFLPAYLGMLDRALRRTAGVRRGGSAALDLCDLACGRLDAFWELWLLPWDVAAGTLIVREAGGWFGPFAVSPRTPEQLSSDGSSQGSPAAPPWPAALGDVAEDAAAFLSLCDGRPTDRPLRGGAYLGANAHLLEAVRRLLAE